MPLNIIAPTDEIAVDNVVVCIYGPPGLGKTSLAFTADRPLLLDCDRGAHRAANRGASVSVSSWGDVDSISSDDLGGCGTIVVDTVGRALDVLSADIIRRNPRLGSSGGALTLQGYGALKVSFAAYLRRLQGFGVDIVLLAHMDEQRRGDDIIERIDVQGGSKAEVYKAADAMGRLTMRDGARWLDWSPTDAAFGKDAGGLGSVPVRDPSKAPHCLAEMISRIKARLNAATEEQRQARIVLAEWRERIDALGDCAAVNDVVAGEIKAAPRAAQAILAQRAHALGLRWSKEAGKYAPIDPASRSVT